MATAQKSAEAIQLADAVNRINVSPTMAVLQEAEKLKAQGIDVADFGPGEPDFPTPEHIKRAVIKALEENRTKYTPVAGILPLRQAICDWHAAQLGIFLRSPTECVVNVGGKHAIFNAVCALINPGDEVIIGAPYWVSYPDMVKYAGGAPVFAETRANDAFMLRASQVEKVHDPENQNGHRQFAQQSHWRRDSARPNSPRIEDLCKRRGVWLLSDECYSHFVYKDAKPFSVASHSRLKRSPDHRRLVLQNFRHDRLAPRLHPRAQTAGGRHRQTAKPVHFQSHFDHSIRGPRSHARLHGFRRTNARRICPPPRTHSRWPARHSRHHLRCSDGRLLRIPQCLRALQRRKCRTPPPSPNSLLEREHVAVTPGEAFGAPGYLRLSYATSIDRIDEGLRRLTHFFGNAA